MLAHVKTPHTDIHIQGEIPARVLDVLRSEYGDKLKIYDDEDVPLQVNGTDWYKKTKAKTTQRMLCVYTVRTTCQWSP